MIEENIKFLVAFLDLQEKEPDGQCPVSYR